MHHYCQNTEARPIQRSIINRDKETGISFMKIIEKLDAGPICKKYKIKIKKNENYNSLLDQTKQSRRR